jgi:hypothetical protein
MHTAQDLKCQKYYRGGKKLNNELIYRLIKKLDDANAPVSKKWNNRSDINEFTDASIGYYGKNYRRNNATGFIPFDMQGKKNYLVKIDNTSADQPLNVRFVYFTDTTPLPIRGDKLYIHQTKVISVPAGESKILLPSMFTHADDEILPSLPLIGFCVAVSNNAPTKGTYTIEIVAS